MDPDRTELKELFEPIGRLNEETTNEVRERLAEFRDESTLKRLFENIRSDEEWLEEIARRSYSHDNGFDKLVLCAFKDPDRKLRLHVWDSAITPQSPSETNVHNHRWNFCSTVLCGEFQFEMYEQVTEGVGFEKYEYAPKQEKEYSLRHRGKEHLEKTFSGRLPRGVEYSISHDVIHRTFVGGDGVTATLMMQGTEQKPTTSVYSLEPLEESSSRTISELSPETVEEKFERVLDAI